MEVVKMDEVENAKIMKRNAGKYGQSRKYCILENISKYSGECY